MPKQLDLTQAYTADDVAELQGSETDEQDWQLRVSNEGVAYLSSSVGADNLDRVLFRFETWDAGNSYVGPDAAADTEFVNRVYEALNKNWPKPTRSYIENY